MSAYMGAYLCIGGTPEAPHAHYAEILNYPSEIRPVQNRAYQPAPHRMVSSG